MSPPPTLRQRKCPRQPHNPSSDPPPPSMKPTRLFKRYAFYIRWFARISLFLLLLLLTNTTFVTIPPPSTSSPSLNRNSIPSPTLLILITHSRPDYLNRSLASIFSHHPRISWPILVSQDRQDGLDHDDVSAVISHWANIASDDNIRFHAWSHDVSYSPTPRMPHSRMSYSSISAYSKIARHYKWVLSRVFHGALDQWQQVSRVVIVEDDMEIAPDFFSYFDALAPMLESDASLYCVSAWNDNGKKDLSWNSSMLYRTDFFPGLGWMLTRGLWEEVEEQWPDIYWDDWMRRDDVRKGRHCIRPEVSRTGNFGQIGVSHGYMFGKHVGLVEVGTENIDWASMDLGYLQEDKFDEMVFGRMETAVRLKYSNYLSSRPMDSDVIAYYPDKHMDVIGKRLGIMTDDRDGIRRTEYKGVVIVPWRGHWAFIVENKWEPPHGFSLKGSTCC